MNQLDTLATNAVRVLGAQAVQQAKSGHPGIALGAAPIGVELFFHQINHDPEQSNWINRDRFVLSAGHGTALLYPLLHMFGYIPMEEVKNFRQWGSKTPGHPEYGHTAGVDATSGPLGQGIAMAVGMAMAQSHLAATFNQQGYPVFDHYTYALCGDGCLQEGVSGEASSFAGSMKLGKLIVLYDSNNITIEGDTSLTFTEDVALRYASYGWQVLKVADGEDMQALSEAIEAAKADEQKPSMIIVQTKIGRYSKLEGSEKSHGAPLGEENVADMIQTLGWQQPPFTLPQELYDYAAEQAKKHGKARHSAWNNMMEGYQKNYPELYDRFMQYTADNAPQIDWENLVDFAGKKMATRITSGLVLNALADKLPNLFGGSADLGPSNKSSMDAYPYYSPDQPEGRNVHYGVREFAMAAIVNGMALHGAMRPYGATFLVFADYMRGALRMSALMDLPIFHILTHDSIGVGEDGPTHQPIETLSSLRVIPNLTVFRPADGMETVAAYRYLLESKKPTILALSRQDLPQLDGSSMQAMKGGYVLSSDDNPEIILIGTGSEVSLCMEAADALKADGKRVRVVSMPCVELFLSQDETYREQVLPKGVTSRVVVEAASSFGWQRIAGDGGQIIGIDHFGASAPGDVLFEKFGFNVQNVVDKANQVMA